MDKVCQIVVRHLWWVVLLTAVGLLVAHTVAFQQVVVDNTSLVLLVIVLASPFVAAIKKIKIGEFEAEIQPDEVKQVAKQVEQALPALATESAMPLGPSDTGGAILELTENDPVIGLAKLRIEIESRLRRLAERTGRTSSSPQPRTMSLGRIVRDLTAQEVLDHSFGGSLLDVIAICNRAIHGEDIREVDARQIAKSGVELLDALDRIVRTFAVTHPVKTTVISAMERDRFDQKKFRLTTVVPLVDQPERREYVLSQSELDDFFDGYAEYAEFVIKVEQLDDDVQATA